MTAMEQEQGSLQPRFMAWKDGPRLTEPADEVVRKFDEFAQEMEEVSRGWAGLASLCRRAASILREADSSGD